MLRCALRTRHLLLPHHAGAKARSRSARVTSPEISRRRRRRHRKNSSLAGGAATLFGENGDCVGGVVMAWRRCGERLLAYRLKRRRNIARRRASLPLRRAALLLQGRIVSARRSRLRLVPACARASQRYQAHRYRRSGVAASLLRFRALCRLKNRSEGEATYGRAEARLPGAAALSGHR